MICDKTKISWLRNKISQIAYGEKRPQGIRPNISKRNIIKNNKILARRIPNHKILDHINNNKTLYYYGNGKTKDKHTLVMIDIDVCKKQNIGSTKGAIEFAKHLTNYFPNLYYEKSTNEKGIHAYIVLEKENLSANIVNKTLKQFENWLKNEAKMLKADIEIVEIKGLCPEVIYSGNNIVNIKYGTLAKIPRNLEEITRRKNETISIRNLEESFSCFKKELKIKKEGSVTNKLFSNKDLSYMEKYKEIFKVLTDGKILKARNHTVSEEDFSIALLILMFLQKNQNIDQSVPTMRVMKLWESLYKTKCIKRNWNHHRWKAIRDLLSKNNLIQWIDNKYNFGDKTNGTKGVACKWKLTEVFFTYILSCQKKASDEQEEASLMDTPSNKTIKIKETIPFIVPVLRFLRVIDYEKLLSKVYSSMESLCYV